MTDRRVPDRVPGSPETAERVFLRSAGERASNEQEFNWRLRGTCLIGIEACATAHHWARLLKRMGHQVRLIPPAYVKPYVKTQKNDEADAEAICEAVTRPNMRFAEIKTVEQQSVLVLHRTRKASTLRSSAKQRKPPFAGLPIQRYRWRDSTTAIPSKAEGRRSSALGEVRTVIAAHWSESI